MKRKEIVDIIQRERIIAIVRLKQQEEISSILDSLIYNGIKVLEITSNTPGYLEAVLNARIQYPKVLIGVGTVINVEIANRAIKAGAQFLVTPNTNIDVIALAHKYNIPVLIGALTPTEVCLAVEEGADIIKLFPAGNLGINYFKAITAPLSHVNFFVVGGVNLENVKDWIEAGASGFGLGSVLTKTSISKSSLKNVDNNTVKEFLKIINESEWIN